MTANMHPLLREALLRRRLEALRSPTLDRQRKKPEHGGGKIITSRSALPTSTLRNSSAKQSDRDVGDPNAHRARDELSGSDLEPTQHADERDSFGTRLAHRPVNNAIQRRPSRKVLPRQVWNATNGRLPSLEVLPNGSLSRRVRSPFLHAGSDGKYIFRATSTLYSGPETSYDWRCEDEMLPNRIAEVRYEKAEEVFPPDIFGVCYDCGSILDWIPVAGPLCKCPGQAPAPELSATRTPRSYDSLRKTTRSLSTNRG